MAFVLFCRTVRSAIQFAEAAEKAEIKALFK